MKGDVEEAVAYIYFLRSFGCQASIPKPICGDNRAAFLPVTELGTALEKKHVVLSYHFCRKHVSANIVDIRLIDGKCNFADAMTKALAKTQLDGHITQLLDNGPGRGDFNETMSGQKNRGRSICMIMVDTVNIYYCGNMISFTSSGSRHIVT